jgi:protein-S-isoprenylcysteine O-methyltransferase Ste14
MGYASDHPWTRRAGTLFAWSGFAIMWLFWISFVIFLSAPKGLLPVWPLPTVNTGGVIEQPAAAALIDVALIALFGLQHSVMARPFFKCWVTTRLPPAFERCLYVHMANLALFALIIFWQPIALEIWTLPRGWMRDLSWSLFALGWLILFAGAWSFGILDLLGINQMRAWRNGEVHSSERLRTGLLYRWLRHPMYVGVLLGVWATPRMTMGQLLLAAGLTLYVLIALRFEERDLAIRFGKSYRRWRESALPLR